MSSEPKASLSGGSRRVPSREQICIVTVALLIVFTFSVAYIQIKGNPIRQAQCPYAAAIWDLSICTTTVTVNTITTVTTTVSQTTPYNWGAWVGILLVVGVVILYIILKSRLRK